MRLLSYSIADSHRFGALTADGLRVVDLTDRLDDVSTLDDLLRAECLDSVASAPDESGDHPLDEVTIERLLPWPRKIFCIGVNYGGRSAEYTDTSDAAYPSVFIRYPDSFVGHGQALIRPPESVQLDYEGEIVAVIGRSGRRIPVGDARSHLAGLTLGNEGSIRDWIRHAKFNVTQGKNWERSGSFGPFLTTIDEIGDLEDMHLTTTVNGEVRQEDSTATMKYSIDYIVHYLSSFTTLAPGDIIFTGTPTGAGARHDPPIWLEPGDVVDVHVPELGTLRNPIADEFDDVNAYSAPAPR